MISDLPHALANVLAAIERERLGYVLYRDPKASQRLVIFVEGQDDSGAIEHALLDAGAEMAGNSGPNDFVMRSEPRDGGKTYLVELKTIDGHASIANLLWLAATDEGAQAARDSIDRD